MLKVNDSNISTLIRPELNEITSRTFIKPNPNMLKDFADNLETSELTADFLRAEVRQLKLWASVDSHNWSDYNRALNENKIRLFNYLANRLDK